MSPMVLVVDDDPDVRALISLTLRSDGIDAVPVGDGTAAISWVRSHGPPAVAVLDVQMPHLDGWATLEELRQIASDLPVLMCTVKSRDSDRARSSDVAFLPKPFSTEQLMHAVRLLLPTQQREGQR